VVCGHGSRSSGATIPPSPGCFTFQLNIDSPAAPAFALAAQIALRRVLRTSASLTAYGPAAEDEPLYPPEVTWQDRAMSWNGRPRRPGGRVRVGRRTISMPGVPSMTDADRPGQPSAPAAGSDRPAPIRRDAVQYLDRVRAIFRPTSGSRLAPGVERFIGVEDIFRHVGEGDMAPHGRGPMMQCPSHWSDGAIRVPIGDLEILEILEDQDVRAG